VPIRSQLLSDEKVKAEGPAGSTKLMVVLVLSLYPE